jgi:hypothetical protein
MLMLFSDPWRDQLVSRKLLIKINAQENVLNASVLTSTLIKLNISILREIGLKQKELKTQL